MSSLPHMVGTLVEVFNDPDAAAAAVQELKAVGFTDSQIEVVSHSSAQCESDDICVDDEEMVEDATTGAAAGLGIGALWGLSVIAGIAPDLTPMHSGALGIVLSSAAAGAATVGTAGALFGIGAHHQSHVGKVHHVLLPGHTLVIVKAGTRADIASSILNRFNDSDRTALPTLEESSDQLIALP